MIKLKINQYDVFWVNLDPTMGSEINKIRPCVVISPDALNEYLNTVIIAPVTTTVKKYPYRADCIIDKKVGSIALDQIKTVDKSRFQKHIGRLRVSEIETIREKLREMFCE